MQVHRLTQETLSNLEAEFNHLTQVERLRIIDEIKAARDNGDLSENADYESALNQQKFVEARIQEIKSILDSYVLIDGGEESSTLSGDIVKIGSKVRVRELETGEETDYEILGSVDNNPQMGRISNECPLAKSILGKRAGDIVEVQNIMFPYSIKILGVS